MRRQIHRRERPSGGGTPRRDPAQPSGHARLLDLQATAGNRAVCFLLAGSLSPWPVVARQAAPAPPAGPAADANAPTEDDTAEFNLLKGKKGTIRNAAGAALDTAEAYVEYRNDHFGSRADYDVARATADTEFDGMKKAVWNQIGQTESKAAKKALWRWVRKAYIDAGVADPVATLKSGMTPELKAKIDAVKAIHADLVPGGFLGRPEKSAKGGYRLGTLSEHGTGKAFDVTPQDKNPHLTVADWKFVQELGGMTVDRKLKRWKEHPADLWQDVHDLNVAYVAELKRRIAAIEDERTKAGKDPKDPPPIDEILKGHKKLLKTAREQGVDHGVFNLDKDLVVDLHGQDLRWGVTFKDVDLHHFEMY